MDVRRTRYMKKETVDRKRDAMLTLFDGDNLESIHAEDRYQNDDTCATYIDNIEYDDFRLFITTFYSDDYSYIDVLLIDGMDVVINAKANDSKEADRLIAKLAKASEWFKR